MLPAVSDWTQWDRLLGTMPDRALAERIGCRPGVVVQRRYKLGIPAFEQHNLVDWAQWDHLLGTMSDTDLAKRIGTTKAVVFNRRAGKGIPNFSPYGWTLEDETLFAQGQAKCVRCGEVMELTAFPGDKTARTGVKRACKTCVYTRAKQDADTAKRYWITQMGGACQCCGEDRYLSALDFHHVDGDEKDENPSRFVSRPGRRDVAARELDKCCLLCANCHRAYHGGELSISFVKRPSLGWTVRRQSASS